jgi:hypothetical protein
LLVLRTGLGLHVVPGIWRAAVFVALGPLTTASPARADAVGVFAGHGQDTDQYGIGIQLDRRTPVHDYVSLTLTGHLEFGVGEFQGDKGAISHNTIRALDALAELRWQRRANGPVVPFVEFGTGMGGPSEVTINGDRHFSTAFQFTEILRTGVRLGPDERFDLAVGAQHFSNAGLKRPNDGITYAGLIGAVGTRGVRHSCRQDAPGPLGQYVDGATLHPRQAQPTPARTAARRTYVRRGLAADWEIIMGIHNRRRRTTANALPTLLVCAAVLCGGVCAAGPPPTCDLQLVVHLTPDIADPSDLSFLGALVNKPGYQLTWIEQRDNDTVVLELTGPGPRVNCQRVVDGMRRNAHVLSIAVTSLRQKQ